MENMENMENIKIKLILLVTSIITGKQILGKFIFFIMLACRIKTVTLFDITSENKFQSIIPEQRKLLYTQVLMIRAV
ncbi:Uncharacterised protein [Yersinia thracica]|uniref:Uncharacterized protein n=1 Tax=Yersinia thracica TaxID=2890319 RepID=A0A0T9PPF8_9GAMM|nr:Uncharacterised protein [Yersinia thracica]